MTSSRLRARSSPSKSKFRTKPRAPARRLSRTPNGTNDEPRQYCVCKGKDEGPMIHCAECDDWFHFECVHLNEDDADDISVFICPPCHEKTSRKTAMRWEGRAAVEEAAGDDNEQQARAETASRESTPPEVASESEDDGSQDEYVDESAVGGRNGRGKKRLVTISSDSEPEEKPTISIPKPRRQSSTSQPPDSPISPRTPHALKRKQSDAGQRSGPKKKRGRRSPAPTVDDPARKFCAGKLEELFIKIFLRYPHVLSSTEEDEEEQVAEEKQADSLSDEDKAKVEHSAKGYAARVEAAMFEMYSEPDKHLKPSVAGKYKERFRMLTYNLSQDDRVVLHRRIAADDLEPRILVAMSSTDLANEETQASIKIAEQESLAQTILTKSAAPRAKITHKGFEEIESVDGNMQKQSGDEEEEDRRERERLARTRPVQPTRERSASQSVPPESPIVPQTPSWGAPPPLPMHILEQANAANAVAAAITMSPTSLERPPIHPLFIPAASNLPTSMEPELNLADLINIDEETDEPVVLTPVVDHSRLLRSLTATEMSPQGAILSAGSLESPSAPSFNLNTLWLASGDAQDPTASPKPDNRVDVRDDAPEADADIGDTNDGDFDMFLEGEDDDTLPLEPQPPSKETSTSPAAFEDLPQVWQGTLGMPLDSDIPVARMVARRVAGRRIEVDSPLWQTLFPSRELRIDGRVPVDKSAQYLLQSRLNTTKELIAVALSPAGDENGFAALMDHLRTKSRHGLIFPWGHHAKEWGKELYIIPLLSSEPLPDYMDMLDELELPQKRDSDLFVGIWVLNKDKLAPPPSTSAASNPYILPPQAVTTSTPTTTQGPPPANALAPQPSLTQHMATLTPEQIQAMLSSLKGLALPLPGVPSGFQLPTVGTPQLPLPAPVIPGHTSPPPLQHALGGPPFGQSPPPNSAPPYPPPPGMVPPFPPNRPGMPPFPPTQSGTTVFSPPPSIGMPPFPPPPANAPPFPPPPAITPPFPPNAPGMPPYNQRGAPPIPSFPPPQPNIRPPGPPHMHGNEHSQWQQPPPPSYPPDMHAHQGHNGSPFSPRGGHGPNDDRGYYGRGGGYPDEDRGRRGEGRGRGRGRGRGGWDRGGGQRDREDEHSRGREGGWQPRGRGRW